MSLIGEIDMPTIRVDKRIPLGPPRRRGKYPWNEMKVGHSFVFPEQGSLTRTKNYATSMICWRHRETQCRYEWRERDEKQPDGSMVKVVRIWRVK